MVEAASLDKLPKLHLLSLELGLPAGKDLVEYLILVVSPRSELINSQFEFLVHVFLLLLNLKELSLQIFPVLLALLLLVLENLKTSLSILQSHLILIEVLQLLRQIIFFRYCIRQRHF